MTPLRGTSRILPVLVILASLMTGQPALAGGRTFVIQEVKRGMAQPLTPGHLDTSDIKRPSPPPSVRPHGIVGLDMKVFRTEYPLIQAVFEDTPAYHAGMLPGDEIVAVNGFSTMGRSREELDAMISDVPGDRIEFTIARGSQLKRITLTVQAATSPMSSDYP